MNTDPLVSIICLTYNEEHFVRDTLDNILSQETNFSYEVLVYDDASDDQTSAILREYEEAHPNIFKLTLFEENNFKKGLGFYGLRIGFSEAKGKYIAYCEGDDYWCDNNKLQKQVDFLESHPEFEVCAHETMIRDDYNEKENGTLFSSKTVNLFIDRTKRQKYDFYDTLTGNIFHVSSMMFRKFTFNWPSWIGQIRAMDMVCFMLLAEKGDIYVMKDVMSVYRFNQKSITSSNAEFQNAISFNNISIEILEKMNEYWNGRHFNAIKKILAGYYINNMFCYLSRGLRDYSSAREMARNARKYDFPSYIKYFGIESYRKLKKHLW